MRRKCVSEATFLRRRELQARTPCPVKARRLRELELPPPSFAAVCPSSVLPVLGADKRQPRGARGTHEKIEYVIPGPFGDVASE
jgi:hypothetical protein